MRLSLAYSPCPNDTFIFYAMMHGKVDTEGLEFEVVLGDVMELNQAAKLGKYDITKLSFHALFHLQDKYQLLQAGAALGNKCGPLLIAKKTLSPKEINEAKVAIPGAWTTANFLLNFAYPDVVKKEVMIFSEIESAVLENRTELGLIIYWEEKTRLPIPLGGIALHQRFDKDLKEKIQRVIRRSLNYAWQNQNETLPYLRVHAQEMKDEVMMKHVNLYVNNFSLDLGEKGNLAVNRLFNELDLMQGVESD